MDAIFVIRLVSLTMNVEHFAFVFDRLESVSEPFRDPQATPIGSTENLAVPAKECRGADTQIHGDIKYRAAQTMHQL